MCVDPPRISLDPERQTVVPGQSASIYCSATGKGPISLRWDTESGAQLPASVYQRDGLLQVNLKWDLIVLFFRFLFRAVFKWSHSIFTSVSFSVLKFNSGLKKKSFIIIAYFVQFSSISVGDQGRYQCTASNADGRAVATAEVIVNGELYNWIL